MKEVFLSEYANLARKKVLIQQSHPLPLELTCNLDEWFRVELTYTSNAIEGNTLTRQEAALVVEKGIAIGGKSLREHLETTNHIKALDFIKTRLDEASPNLTERDILSIHQCILKGIDDQNAGRYRTVAVRIAGSRVILPNPAKVPQLMSEFVHFLQSAMYHPVELAARAHYDLVTIHPFIDGNGRTARLLMNLILLQNGYPPAIIRTEDRLDYIKSLEEAQLGGSPESYYQLIIQAVDRSLDIYLEAIRNSK